MVVGCSSGRLQLRLGEASEMARARAAFLLHLRWWEMWEGAVFFFFFLIVVRSGYSGCQHQQMLPALWYFWGSRPDVRRRLTPGIAKRRRVYLDGHWGHAQNSRCVLHIASTLSRVTTS